MAYQPDRYVLRDLSRFQVITRRVQGKPVDGRRLVAIERAEGLAVTLAETVQNITFRAGERCHPDIQNLARWAHASCDDIATAAKDGSKTFLGRDASARRGLTT